MLVVVEDRDAHLGLEAALDLEAVGRADVLEVDPAEGRLEQLDGADELLGVFGVELEVEDVDVGEPLEEDALALHHRLAGQGADVAETEHGGAVRDDGDQVALGGVLVGELRIPLDLQARLGDARGVGQGEVALGRRRLRRQHLDLSLRARVVLERFGARDLLHDARV